MLSGTGDDASVGLPLGSNAVQPAPFADDPSRKRRLLHRRAQRTYLRVRLPVTRNTFRCMFWLGNKIFHGLKSLWAKLRGGANDAATS